MKTYLPIILLVLMAYLPTISFSKETKSNIHVSVSVVESCVIKTKEIDKCTKGLKQPTLTQNNYIVKKAEKTEEYKNNTFIF